MRHILPFLILAFSFTLPIMGQDENQSQPCLPSTKFDEFDFTSIDSLKEKLDLFGLQIKTFRAQGLIVGYGGRNTESNEGRDIARKIEDYLNTKFQFSPYYTIAVRDGGHRSTPSAELFIKPESCSSDPQFSATLNLDEVTFKEEKAFFDDNVARKTQSELSNLMTREMQPAYPPAAHAVRARGKVIVLVLIDEKGSVIKALALDGHPLLRAASEAAVRTVSFRELENEKRPIKYGGKIVIDWDEIADRLDQSSNQ